MDNPLKKEIGKGIAHELEKKLLDVSIYSFWLDLWLTHFIERNETNQYTNKVFIFDFSEK